MPTHSSGGSRPLPEKEKHRQLRLVPPREQSSKASSEKLSELQKKLIAEADWSAIRKRLTKEARVQAKRRGWHFDEAVPDLDGRTPKEIPNEAIARLSNGDRSWDPTEIDLLGILLGTVKSIFGTRSAAGRKQRQLVGEEEENHLRDRVEIKAAELEGGNLAVAIPENPETIAEKRQLVQRVIECVQSDRDLLEIIEAMRRSQVTKPADLAELTKLPVKEVYKRLRRLRKRVRSLQ